MICVIYRNIDEYNPNKKCKTLIVFDDIITVMFSNRDLKPVVTELFIRSRKINIFCFYYTILF